MGLEAKNKTTELVVRIRPRNGKDEISADDVAYALQHTANALGGTLEVKQPKWFPGHSWIVQEVEGGTLDAEMLGVAVRECLQTIYASMGKGVVEFIRDCGKEWDSVKDRVEPLLQGKFATCQQCGCPVLTTTLVDGEKYDCLECGAKLRWKLLPNEKRPELARYILQPR